MILKKVGNREIMIGISVMFLIVFSILFGFTGLRFIFGFLAVIILPLYLILDRFKFTTLEKVVYSFFLGIGLVSTLVYYLGILISFRVAIGVVFVVLVGIGWFLRKKGVLINLFIY